MVRSNVNAIVFCKLGDDGMRVVVEAAHVLDGVQWLLRRYGAAPNDWVHDGDASARVSAAE